MALTRFHTDDCRLSIFNLVEGQLLIELEGRDLGQLGRKPFAALEAGFSTQRALELCFDLRRATGATLEASSGWAHWLRQHRGQLSNVHMLTSRPVITLTAKTIQRVAGLGDAAKVFVSRQP
jgi:hypothetical protein